MEFEIQLENEIQKTQIQDELETTPLSRPNFQGFEFVTVTKKKKRKKKSKIK